MNDKLKWHKITSILDTPQCHKYKEVAIKALPQKEDELAYFEIFNNRKILRERINSLLGSPLFKEVFWMYIY